MAALLAQAPESPPDQSFGFAESLFAEGDHYRAITEYKRYLYLQPDGENAHAARMAIGLSYLRGGQAEAAALHYRSVAEQLPDPLKADAHLQAAYARYVGNQPVIAYTDLQTWLSRYGDRAPAPVRARAAYLLAWTELELGQDAAAAQRFATLAFPEQPDLLAAAKRFEHLPQKSPLLAGVLSIIPGAGHVYIGQPMIGLTALLWNGLFGYALYEAIANKQIGLSIALGVFEFLWYSGSIFGAVSGAMKFNRDARRNAMEDLRERFDDRPESWPPAPSPSPTPSSQ